MQKYDLVAQLVEQLTLNQWVESSSLSQVTEIQQVQNKICSLEKFAESLMQIMKRKMPGKIYQAFLFKRKELF